MWVLPSASIMTITALPGVLMTAVLLVGSGFDRYRTSVLQRVRLALNSMSLTANCNRVDSINADILCRTHSVEIRFYLYRGDLEA